ncbi:MAG: tetratricopeptide repeat protein [Pirellulales bacterium]|nr:tetratricopeptide repeat protein [Pirellulales bacterium]
MLTVVVAAVALSMARPESTPALTPAAGTDAASRQGTVLEDPVEPLVVKQGRSEAEQDRLTALSLYGAARMKQQQDELPAALRLYERAFRLDPSAASVAREIVGVALELGRQEEGMRYAVKAASLDPSDTVLVDRVAMLLTQSNDLAGARQLYEKLAAAKTAAGEPTDHALLWSIGRLYFLEGDFKEAVPTFQQVTDALLDPQQHKLEDKVRGQIVHEAARTYELLGDSAAVEQRTKEALALEFFGEAFLAGESPNAAQRVFAEAEKLGGKSKRHAFNQARALKLKEDDQGAAEQIELYLQEKSSTDNAEAYRLLADVQTKLGQREALLARLEKLADERTGDAALKAELARQHRQDESYDKAAKHYEALISDAKPNKRRPPLEAYRALLDIYRRQANDKALLEIATRGLAILPTMEVFGEEGDALVADLPAVERMANTAREQGEPGRGLSFETTQAVALVALKAKHFNLASEFFEKSLLARPKQKGELLRSWGVGLLVAEQYAEAAKIFRRALDEKVVGDDAAEFEFHLAGTLEMSGQTEEALAAARRAAELVEQQRKEDEEERQISDAAYFRILSREPWVLYHAKRYGEAAAEYRALVERFDAEEKGEAARETLREARLMLSNLAVNEHDMPQAEEWLEQILDEYPDDISALNDLGYLWAEQGKRLDRALAMIQQALVGDPDNKAYRDSLGWAFYQLGRYEEARVELEQAAAEEEPDGVILDHLGDVYSKLQQTDKARDSWTRAIERFKHDADAAKERATRDKLERLDKETKPANP